MNYRLKNKIKIILDIILLCLTLTLFNKTLISMKYHEITGLIVIAIMLVHIGINIKTAKAMCVKFAKLPAALKACIIVDILLLITFLWFGISGVLCSKTILTGISSSNAFFKLYHMAAGAAALILLGIHIGLHICRCRFPKKLAIIITVIFVAAGAYSVVNSNFLRWASIPFTVSLQQNTENPPQRNSTTDRPDRQNDNSNIQHNESSHGKPADSSSVIDKSADIAMYFSIIAAFSMLTYVIAVPKRKIEPCKKV